jgi:hypothetical protein
MAPRLCGENRGGISFKRGKRRELRREDSREWKRARGAALETPRYVGLRISITAHIDLDPQANRDRSPRTCIEGSRLDEHFNFH